MMNPKATAAPRAPLPPAPKLSPGQVLSRRSQDEYAETATQLAADLGWTGQADWELHDIRVADASGYLTQKLHEIHQASLNDHVVAPTAEAVCQHLGITDADEVAHVTAALAALAKREADEAPQNAASASLTPAPKVVGMSAKLEGDVTTLMSGGTINPTGKR